MGRDKDKDFEFRTAVYDEIVYAYVRYLTFVLGDIGGIYLNERYDGDQRPSFKTVSKQQQKKALNFLLNELKDLSWLDARETLKEFSDVKAEVEKLLDVFKFRDAQKEAMNLARIGNNTWQIQNLGNLPRQTCRA